MRLTTRGKVAVALALIGGLVVVPAVGGLLWLRSIGVVGAGDGGRKVIVVVPEGANASEIGRILEDAGVIRSAVGFRVAATFDAGAGGIQAGRYELPTGLGARDALAALLEGPLPRDFVTVTFPEGSWLTDFARIVGRDTHVSEEDFAAVLDLGAIRSRYQPKGVDSLEGLLFPSTYQVIEDDDAGSLARRFVAEFDEQVAALDGSRLGALGVSRYEAVVIASMVELEAKFPEERGKVARVIYNRLERGMTLGIDATVQYAIGERKSDLTVSDLAVDSPYNTRKVAGLPPTPIGAPGVAALEAAFDPPPGEWLFFVVSDCEGHHEFVDTAQEFAVAKAAYQALDC